MKTKEVIEHYGSAYALAKDLAITPQAISQWGETVPTQRQFQIEIRTNGAFKADTK